MTINFITMGLIYIVIGFGLALVFYYLLNWNFIGKVWGGVFVGIAGSFAGGVIDVIVQDLRIVTLIVHSVNIIPPCVVSCVFLWVFHKISTAPETY